MAYNINLNLQSEALDGVSKVLNENVNKIEQSFAKLAQTAQQAKNNPIQKNVDVTFNFKPLEAGISSTTKALGSFQKALLSVTTQSTKTTSSAAKTKGSIEVKASDLTFDFSKLGIKLAGVVDLDVSGLKVDSSGVKISGDLSKKVSEAQTALISTAEGLADVKGFDQLAPGVQAAINKFVAATLVDIEVAFKKLDTTSISGIADALDQIVKQALDIKPEVIKTDLAVELQKSITNAIALPSGSITLDGLQSKIQTSIDSLAIKATSQEVSFDSVFAKLGGIADLVAQKASGASLESSIDKLFKKLAFEVEKSANGVESKQSTSAAPTPGQVASIAIREQSKVAFKGIPGNAEFALGKGQSKTNDLIAKAKVAALEKQLELVTEDVTDDALQLIANLVGELNNAKTFLNTQEAKVLSITKKARLASPRLDAAITTELSQPFVQQNPNQGIQASLFGNFFGGKKKKEPEISPIESNSDQSDYDQKLAAKIKELQESQKAEKEGTKAVEQSTQAEMESVKATEELTQSKKETKTVTDQVNTAMSAVYVSATTEAGALNKLGKKTYEGMITLGNFYQALRKAEDRVFKVLPFNALPVAKAGIQAAGAAYALQQFPQGQVVADTLTQGVRGISTGLGGAAGGYISQAAGGGLGGAIASSPINAITSAIQPIAPLIAAGIVAKLAQGTVEALPSDENSAAFKRVENKIEGGVDKVVQELTDRVEPINQAIEGLKTQAADSSVGQGLMSAVEKMTAAADAVKGAAESVKDGVGKAKDTLQQAPAKVVRAVQPRLSVEGLEAKARLAQTKVDSFARTITPSRGETQEDDDRETVQRAKLQDLQSQADRAKARAEKAKAKELQSIESSEQVETKPKKPKSKKAGLFDNISFPSFSNPFGPKLTEEEKSVRKRSSQRAKKIDRDTSLSEAQKIAEKIKLDNLDAKTVADEVRRVENAESNKRKTRAQSQAAEDRAALSRLNLIARQQALEEKSEAKKAKSALQPSINQKKDFNTDLSDGRQAVRNGDLKAADEIKQLLLQKLDVNDRRQVLNFEGFEISIDTTRLKQEFDRFKSSVDALDQAGITDEGIAALRVLAQKFDTLPGLANSAKSKIDKLQDKKTAVDNKPDPAIAEFKRFVSLSAKAFQIKDSTQGKKFLDKAKELQPRQPDQDKAKLEIRKLEQNLVQKSNRPAAFKELASIAEAKARNKQTVSTKELGDIRFLAKTEQEFLRLDAIIQKLNANKLSDKFREFELVVQSLTGKGKLTADQLQAVSSSADQFKGTVKELAAAKKVDGLAKQVDPVGKSVDLFANLLATVKTVIARGETPAASDVLALNRLAESRLQKEQVTSVASDIKKNEVDKLLSALKDLILVKTNRGAFSESDRLDVLKSRNRLQGTSSQEDAIKLALAFQAKAEKATQPSKQPNKDELFNAELKIQKAQKAAGDKPDTAKLENLAIGSELNTLIFRAFDKGLSEAEISQSLKSFSTEVKEAQLNLKSGTSGQEQINDLTVRGNTLAKTPETQNIVNSKIKDIQSTFDTAENARFRDAKSGLKSSNPALQEASNAVIKELADGTGKLKQQAIDFLLVVKNTASVEALLLSLNQLQVELKSTGANAKTAAQGQAELATLLEGIGNIKTTPKDKLAIDKKVNEVSSTLATKSKAENKVNPDKPDSVRRDARNTLSDLYFGLQLATSGLTTFQDVITRLAESASALEVNLNRLNIANKGAAGQTEKDLAFARQQVKGQGVSQQSTIRNLATLRLSTELDGIDEKGNKKQPKINAQDTTDIVKGLQNASTANQLSADDAKGVATAIEQVLNKGSVQSEEIKRQLSNYLPGAFSLFAQSQGIGTGELEKRLRRGDVDSSAVTDFAKLLTTKFGGLAEKETAVKSVNVFKANAEELGLRAARPLGSALQTGLSGVNGVGGVNGVLQGATESASTFGAIGAVAGTAFVASLVPKLIGAAAESTNPIVNVFKDSVGSLFKDGIPSLNPKNFTRIGNAIGLTLGAGLFSAVASSITGSEGLDALLTKSAKNASTVLSGIKLPSFGEDKRSARDKEIDKAQSSKSGEIFSQVLPAAGLIGAGLQAALAAADGIKARGKLAKEEKAAAGNNALGAGASALGLIGGPIASVVVPLVSALGLYALSNTTLASGFKDSFAETQVGFKRLTDELARTNKTKPASGGTDAKPLTGGKDSLEGGRFLDSNINLVKSENALNRFIFEANDQSKGAQAAVGRITNEGLDKYSTELSLLTDEVSKRRSEIVKTEIRARKSGKTRDTSQGKFVQEEQADRIFKDSKESTDIIEQNAKSIKIGLTLNPEDQAKVAQVVEQLGRDRAEAQSIKADSFEGSPEETKARLQRLSELDNAINTGQRTLSDLQGNVLKANVNTAEEQVKSFQIAIDNLQVSLDKEAGAGNDTKRLEEEINRIKDLKANAVKTADRTKEVFNAQDPAKQLALAADAFEQSDRAREKRKNTRSKDIATAEGQSIALRGQEGNDRDQNTRTADIGILNAKSDLTALEEQLASLSKYNDSLKLLSPSDETEKKIQDTADKIDGLNVEIEKNRTTVAGAELQKRVALESKLFEEADLKRARQQRKLDKAEAKGSIGNTVDASFQFNINAARLAERASIRAEGTAKTQVADQKVVVGKTTINKEAQQEKLADLEVASLQKTAARVQAVRARREAEESRMLEIADIKRAARDRAIATRESIATRVKPSYTNGDNLFDAGQKNKAASRSVADAELEVLKQQEVLSKTKFGREAQFAKLEDLKAAKQTKITEEYLAQLARIKAEYDLIAANANEVASALTNVKTARDQESSIAGQLRDRISLTPSTSLSAPDTSVKAQQLSLASSVRDVNTQVNGALLSNLQAFNTKAEQLTGGTTGNLNEKQIARIKTLSPAQVEADLAAAKQAKAVLSESAGKGGAQEINLELNNAGLRLTKVSGIYLDSVIELFSDSLTVVNARKQKLDEIANKKQDINELTNRNILAGKAKNRESEDQINQKTLDRNVIQDQEARRIKRTGELFKGTGGTNPQQSLSENLNSLADNINTDKIQTDGTKRQLKIVRDRELQKIREQLALDLSDTSGQTPAQIKQIRSNAVTAEQNAQKQFELDSNPISTQKFGDFVEALGKYQQAFLNAASRIDDVKNETRTRTNAAFEIRKTIGLRSETKEGEAKRGITNQSLDFNFELKKAQKALEREASPVNIRTAIDKAKKVANPEQSKVLNQFSSDFEKMITAGKLDTTAVAELAKVMSNMAITADELAKAVERSNTSIAMQRDIENQTNNADLQLEADRAGTRSGTGRFSGVEDETSQGVTYQRKVNARSAQAKLNTSRINQEEFDSKEALTPEQRDQKFGARRRVEEARLANDLADLVSPSRALADNLASAVSSGLNFSEAFRAADGDIGKAASAMGQSILNNLADYFSKKAQDQLKDIFGGFFEGVIDSIMGTAKKAVTGGAQPDLLGAVLPSVAPVAPSVIPPALAQTPSIALSGMASNRLTPEVMPSTTSHQNMSAPSFLGTERSIFSPYHPDNQPKAKTDEVIIDSQNEDVDYSKVPDLGDNRPDLPANTAAIEANTAAITGQVAGVEGKITDGLTGIDPAEDAAFSNNLPSTLDSTNQKLEQFSGQLINTIPGLEGFGGLLTSLINSGGGQGGGGMSGLFSGLTSMFGGGEGGDVGSEVFNSLVPSFASGTLDQVKMGYEYPSTPTRDPRERGAQSHSAVIGANEIVVPADKARSFLDYTDKMKEAARSNTSNVDNRVSNSNSYSTNNNYLIQGDTFRRSPNAGKVIVNGRAGDKRLGLG